jgi:uncharacterized membrane protein
VSLTYPLALLIIPAFLVLFALARSGSRRFSDPKSWILLLPRIVAVIAAALALADPFSVEKRAAREMTALLDISSSVNQRQGQELLDHASDLAQAVGVPLRVVPFGRSSAPVAVKVSSGESYAKLRAAWQRLDTGGSNLAAAISSPALAGEPLALLLSDGYETTGAVRDVGIGGTPIFPLSSSGEDLETDLAISQLAAPRSVAAQRSVDVRATFTNSSDQDRRAEIELKHGDKTLIKKQVSIRAERDLSITAQSDPAAEGLLPIQAALSWVDDKGAHSITKTIWMAGEKRDKVLIISGSAEDDRFLSKILASQAYQLRSHLATDSRLELGKLSDYRVVVLNNLHISRMPQAISAGVSEYLKNGGGLVVVGGNTSFGLGGYIGSSLEEVLPVRLVPPRQDKKRLTIAVQLVIDKSRSMATDIRLEFAKAAATEVVRALKDEDHIGVIGFDEVPFVALPLSRVGSVREMAVGRISRLFPASRTNLFPALDEARRGLVKVQAGRKHVIVLTDGKLPDADTYYFNLVQQMRFLGITVSTVMVGNEADDGFLERLAQLGGGAFYQTTDPSNLPKVFLSDVRVASGEKTLREEPELAVSAGPDPIVSTELRGFPNLKGFVETVERESARTELLIRDSEGAYPLLASWDVGKGRSIAFTSDSNGRWSANWMRWDRVYDFWSDLIESARRAPPGKPHSKLPFDLRTWVEGSDVIFDLSIFEEINSARVSSEVTTPSGEKIGVDLDQISAGHYRGRIPRAMAGTYRAAITVGIEALPPVAWDIDGGVFGERPHRIVELSVLGDIAKRSGGIMDPKPSDLTPLLEREVDRVSYVRQLLALALAAAMFELIARAFYRRVRVY